MARDGLRSLLLVEAEAGATALPPVPSFDGIEFLEFAVDEQSGRRLGETLRGLGFHYAGRHRSKSVDLFRQGRINMILNSEQDSAAAEHFQFHGPSVCAMAFRVDNAAQAVARAEALLCPPWQEQTGPGERQIPAVRAPDGTLLYLVEPRADGTTIYDVDFNLFEASGARIVADSVDHVAQALPMGRMDNFVLFYRALFGFIARTALGNPRHDGADPKPHHGQRRPHHPAAAEHLGKPRNHHRPLPHHALRRRRAAHRHGHRRHA